jgi:hypothetical protein
MVDTEVQNNSKADSEPRDWVDVVATVIMAVAAIATAWSALQSDQWSDTMSFSLNAAGAARTEASREFTRAGQLTSVDVATFVAWVEAVEREGIPTGEEGTGTYEPDPNSASGFLYLRFRPEFRVAFDAWLATRPLLNADAPPTPFAMEEYLVAETVEAERLQQQAEDKVAEAQAADRNDDRYVLSTLIFAGLFLFAGLSTKMRSRVGQVSMVGVALLFLVGGIIYLVSVPVQV